MIQKTSIDLGEVTLTAPRHLVAKAIISLATGQAPANDSVNVPRLGHPWPGQGGIYVGIMRGEDGLADYHLIVGVGDGAEMSGAWGERGKIVCGAGHDRDGMANTVAMADAGSALAKNILDLQHEGHNDWYLPSRQELAMCWMNTDGMFSKEWHWSSTQYSADYAFNQIFNVGFQLDAFKYYSFRARAVRRFVI